MKNKFFIILPLSLLVLTNACKKDDDENTDPNAKTLEIKTYTNLDATASGSQGQIGGHYTLFSFSTGNTVSITDSATTKWDIGFRSTSVIINGGTSGPGNAGVIIKSSVFDDIKEADASGYIQDNGAVLAIPTGSGNGWYNYDGATNIISPIAGKVFVVRTADNKYAKFEIISYYKDAPAQPDANSVSRYYTFRYVYQPNGTTKIY
jgi:hypothetical protein